jgi:type IV pilus assembly protein PilM
LAFLGKTRKIEASQEAKTDVFSFLRNKVCPIGIDLGGYSLKMVQLSQGEKGLELVAAGQAEIPSDVFSGGADLHDWYVKTIRQLIGERPFRGRKAVICLPAREMLIQHMRVAKMDNEQLKKALPWEAQGKVPFDITKALFRHIVAGDVYDGQEPKCEVILMAAARNVVQKYLRTTERAKIEIAHINVEPFAYMNCFGHLLGPREGEPATVMFIDLGRTCTKIVIAHERSIVFARTIPIAGDHFERASNHTNRPETGFSGHELNRAAHKAEERNNSPFRKETEIGVAMAVQEGPAGTNSADNWTTPEQVLADLCEQVRGCVRYHDLMFNTQPVRRAIFLGGLAKKREFCQRLAQGVGLPAQLGDPLARICAETRVGPHSDLVNDQSYPEWAVAFGLSLGGMKVSEE